jgi:hypothetical protein
MMTAMEPPIPAEQLTIVPANEASWDDLTTIFGPSDPGRCQCQRFKVLGWIWRDSIREERTAMLRAQTACGDPNAAATSGLVAYVDDDPAGWVAVEPRTAYPKLRTSRIPWSGRDEDKGDDDIWAVKCTLGPNRSSRTPGSRRSAVPPSGGWSCGSTSNRTATHVDGRDR